jgi:hypothetical protein
MVKMLHTTVVLRDEVEEVANSAVKEEQIEVKLAAIESDWAAFNLVRVWRRGLHRCGVLPSRSEALSTSATHGSTGLA